MIVDHQAASATGASVTSTLHRIEETVVKQEVLSAGFVLDGESDLLRHAADDHTRKVVETPFAAGPISSSCVSASRAERRDRL